MKILIYNKMRIKKMGYKQACNELSKEIDFCKETANKKKVEKTPSEKFKESFEKLKNE